MSKAIDAMIASAISTLGVAETNGDNVNIITNWYGEDGQPWCDMAVTFWAYHSGNSSAVCFNQYHDYTVEHAQMFYDHGQWHTDVAGIQAGDIVFFDWEGSDFISAIDHVGVVEFVDADGVHTIEGNIDNVCKRMLRHSDFIAGYGRPSYALDPTPTPTPTPPPVRVPTVSLAKIRAAATGDPTGYPTETGLVQNALAKLGLISFSDRGTYGPLTKAGYSRYQQSLGYSGSDADGVPGGTSLTKLGASTGLFKAAA